MRSLSNTRLLSFTYLLLAANLLVPIEAPYLSSLGCSTAQISLLNLSVPFLCAILEIPTGLFGDWVGRKRTVLLSVGSALLSTFLLLEARSFFGLLVAYFFEAAGVSFFSGNTEAFVIEDSKRRSQDVNRNLSLFFSALTLGAIFAGVLSSGAIVSGGTGDLRAPLVLMAVLRGVAVPVSLLLTPTPRDKGNPSPTAMLSQALKLTRERFTLLVILFEGLGRLSFYLPIIMQLFLLRTGVDVEALGVIFSLLLVIQYFFQRRTHVIIERFGRRVVLNGTTLIIVAGLLLMLLSHAVPIVLGMLLVQIVGPLRFQCLSLVKNEVVNDEIRATYLSSISLCVLMFNSTFLALIGWLVEQQAALGLIVLAASVAAGLLLTPSILESQKLHLKERLHADA